METATENKLTYDEQERLISLYKTAINDLTIANSDLTDKANAFEIEVVEKGIEIEGLKQKNILLTDKLEAKKIECCDEYRKYADARDKGNDAIHNLEISQFWKTVSLAALAGVSIYAVVITLLLIHFSN